MASSPRCRVADVRVTQISDGDTIGVRLGGGTRYVRFTGINAMELTRYSNHPSRRRGACHGVEAAAVVDRLVRAAHWRVRLSAQHASSSSGHRMRRSVWARVGGRWVDVGRQVIARGLALWLPNSAEWAHDREYHALAEAARARGVGLWDPTACGTGPEQDARPELRAKYDADGNDAANLDGEWVEVRNRGERAVALAGWWLRDSDLRFGGRGAPGFRFAPGTTVPAGGSVVLHSGCGRDDGHDMHWCQKAPVLDNVSSDARAFGDGAYLFDPQGDLRTSTTWPCLRACADPLQGRVRLAVHPRTPEQVTVTNTSAGEVDLGRPPARAAPARARGQLHLVLALPGRRPARARRDAAHRPGRRRRAGRAAALAPRPRPQRPRRRGQRDEHPELHRRAGRLHGVGLLAC